MSIPLIIVAASLLALICALSLYIKHRFETSLTSVEEKSAGLLFYYRSLLSSIFTTDAGLLNWLALVHYVALHLLIPVGGLGFWLRTDGNFLIVILSLFLSVQLAQRLYPGTVADLDDDIDADDGR